MKKKLFLLFLMGMFTNAFAQFTEGFENGIPQNWTIINGGEITTWSHITNAVQPTEPFWMHSGNGAASITRLWGTQDDYLITPAITVAAGVNDRISFWCARFNTSDEEGLEVTISTTTPDVAGMAAIDAIIPEVVNHSPFYKKYTYDLSGYVGQTIYMGFHSTQTLPLRLCIDDFTNDALPTVIPGCSTITYPENGATNVDHVGLIKWTEVPGIVGYAVILGTTPGGAEVYDALDVSDVTTKSIGPLELATTYYATIVPYNNMGVAVGCTEYSFTTRGEILGDFCNTAIDLSTMPSTFTSTTTGAGDDDFGCYLWTGPDIYYSIEVPNGSTLSIRQTHNGYQSANTIFYGGCANRTEIYCGIALDLYNAFSWKNTTGASQKVYWVQYGTGFTTDQNDGEFTIEWSLANCTFPTATYQTVSNCDVTPGFFINVDITNMGSADTLHITDNQGSAMQATTATGIVQFGPYPIGTPVLFTIVNADEASCFINSTPIALAICPPDCSQATVINEGEETSCMLGAGAGAWNFPEGPSSGMEKLYSFTPIMTGKYFVETVWDGENMDEMPINFISLFYKTADESCDSGWNYLSTSDFFGAYISDDDLIAGTEYLLLFDAMETTGSFNKFKITYEAPPCSSAVASYTIITECEEGADFYVDLNIESLGAAPSHSLWVSSIDGPVLYDQITETGVITLGPFPYGSYMTYSLYNDLNCPWISSNGNIKQVDVCPNFQPECTTLTYPENSATAVALSNINGSAGIVFTWDPYVGSIPTIGYSIYVGTTPNNLAYILTTPEPNVTLIGFTANTTYYWRAVPYNTLLAAQDCEIYSFTTGAFIPNGYCLNGLQGLTGSHIPSCTGTPEIVVQYAYAGYYEYVNVIEGEQYTFASTGTNPAGVPDLITIGSEDGTIALAWGTSPITWTATVTESVRFYIHLSELCQGDELWRDKTVTCGTLSTPAFDISELKAYPNPTKDILNLTYINGIKEVTILNLLGQEVISKKVDASEAKIDMQGLSSGTYLVKINSTANETKTVKIVKE